MPFTQGNEPKNVKVLKDGQYWSDLTGLSHKVLSYLYDGSGDAKKFRHIWVIFTDYRPMFSDNTVNTKRKRMELGYKWNSPLS